MQENINKIYTDALNKTASYLRLIGGNEVAERIVDSVITNHLQVLARRATIATHVHTERGKDVTKS
mgnify:CR=1 FL=1